MYVDNCAMQLVRNPRQFDVIVTSNIFGDILTDEASQVAGSIGMLASASLGAGKLGLYEPIHGSAPDIAGKNLANPLATILSVPMLFRYSLGLTKEAEAIEAAVNAVLDAGWRTGEQPSRNCRGVVWHRHALPWLSGFSGGIRGKCLCSPRHRSGGCGEGT